MEKTSKFNNNSNPHPRRNSGNTPHSDAPSPRRSKQQLVYGIRPVVEAIEAGTTIDKVLLLNGADGRLLQELKALIRQHDIPFQYVPEEKLSRLTSGNHQGVVATVSPIRYRTFADILQELEERHDNPFLLLLDHVTDVRNLGAIVRTAECAGVHAVIIPDHGSAQINEDAIKTSSGALLRVPICREANLKTAINLAKQSGIRVVAASEKASQSYLSIRFSDPTLIVMGAEDSGISNDILRLCDFRAALPIRGDVQSLNVSVAAAIFMYEVLRQRNG